MKKSKLENKVVWLYKNFIKIWFTTGMLIIVSIILSTNQISFGCDSLDGSEIGWAHFINVFKVPLSFIGLGIPIYGIIVTMYRSLQNEKQLELFRQNVNFNNYYRHMDEFLKKMSSYFDKIGGWGDYTNEDKLRTLYVKWYGAEFKTDFMISRETLNLVEEFYDRLNTLCLRTKNVNIPDTMHIIEKLGFEKQVSISSITNLTTTQPIVIDDSIHNVIKVCETILKFSNQEVKINKFVKDILSS